MERNAETLQKMIDLCAQTPAILEAMLAPISDEQFDWTPNEEEWSIRQTVLHLYDVDNLAFAGRIQYIMANDGGTLPGISTEDRDKERAPANASKEELLTLFRQRRTQNCAEARHHDPDQLEASVSYRDMGNFSAWDFVLEWPYHDHSHLNQIGDILKAQIAPAFSPTMAKALGEA